LGFSLGYNFSEYFALQATVFKDFTSYSSALETFKNDKQGVVNYNAPQWYYGLEAKGSLLYGKLSVVGKSIIYYDMYLLGGFGLTNTENGTYATPDIGLGQQVYLTKNFSLRLDYRLMFYHERIKEREIPTSRGEDRGSRNNYSNVITLGVGYMFGGPSKEKAKPGASRQ
jgi:outer membrane beta-barrel protein